MSDSQAAMPKLPVSDALCSPPPPSSSDSVDCTPASKYAAAGGLEALRAANMREIARIQAQLDIDRLTGTAAAPHVQKRVLMKRKKKDIGDTVPVRKSARVAQLPARLSFKEAGVELDGFIEGTTRMSVVESGSDGKFFHSRRGYSEMPARKGRYTIEDFRRSGESYTQEHIAALGTCTVPWPHVGFIKVYDQDNGTCCHQCRQKTIDDKVKCSVCPDLGSYFCGTCLQARYGENMDEALANPYWLCPDCRGICNCSMCRPRDGKISTGILAPIARKAGYESVAHYLVHELQEEKIAAPKVPSDTADSAGAAAVEQFADTLRTLFGDDDLPLMALIDQNRNLLTDTATPPALASSGVPQKRQEQHQEKKSKLTSELTPLPGSQSRRRTRSDAQRIIPDAPYEITMGDVVAVRPDQTQTNDKLWFAVAVSRRGAAIAVQWFEKVDEVRSVYVLEDSVDMVPRGSVLKHPVQLARSNGTSGLKTRTRVTVMNVSELTAFAEL